MEVTTLILRTLIMYFTIYIVFRIMGKREIGKLSVFDLVISIMIAEIAVFVLEDLSKNLLEGIIPMATLVTLQVLIAYISLKSHKIRTIFDEQPSFLIKKGKIDRKELGKQRYSLSDLLLQLRENNVSNVADVEFAILEPTGKLTVIEKDEKEKNNSKAAKATNIRFEGLPYPLIMDGKVQDESLTKIGKTRFWLKNQLQTQGVYDFKDVFFCSIDHRGQLFIDKK